MVFEEGDARGAGGGRGMHVTARQLRCAALHASTIRTLGTSLFTLEEDTTGAHSRLTLLLVAPLSCWSLTEKGV